MMKKSDESKKPKKSQASNQSNENKQSGKSQFEETFKVSGEDLLKKVKEILKEGNVRKIIIKGKNDHVIMEIPLTIGVVLTVLLPVLAAVGAIAALVTECSITVVREK